MNMRYLSWRHQGFAYLVLLILIAAMSLSLGITKENAVHAAQREREKQLIFVGKQFIQAIKSYYENSPNIKQYPKTIEQLLVDNRFPKPMHHLRKIYRDPMLNETYRQFELKNAKLDEKLPWQLLRNRQGFIVGISSASKRTPIGTHLDEAITTMPNIQAINTYADWKFVYLPEGDIENIEETNSTRTELDQNILNSQVVDDEGVDLESADEN
ncbi:MAG: type II secretion system protein [Methylotenera sp.]